MKNKRSLIVLLFALAVVFSFCVIPTQAANSTATLILSPIQTAQDEEFTTTLSVADGSEIVNFNAELLYDTDVVTLVSAKVSKNIDGEAVVNTPKEGVIKINYDLTSENTYEEMPIVDLTFQVDENAGPGSYDLLKLNPNSENTADRWINDAPVAIPLEGSFEKLNIYEFGDIDLNGDVQIRDVTYLRRYLVSLGTLTDYQLRFADARFDQDVNIRDAVYIQQKLAAYDVTIGNRAYINFYDAEGNLYTRKSVKFGLDLNKVPLVPAREDYGEGMWSTSPTDKVEPDLTNIQKDLDLYAVYGDKMPKSMAHYKQLLTTAVYSGDLPTNLRNLILPSELTYQGNESARVLWTSSNNATLNASTGEFSKPTYDSTVTLTATIIAYKGGVIDAQDTIDFDYSVNGVFKTPTKAEIANWLSNFFGDGINYDLKLPQKLSNSEIESSDPYEVRIEWQEKGSDGALSTASVIERDTRTQIKDLVATVTFNGKPLEDDGKIYFDDLTVAPITQNEIRMHIIEQIAANTGISLTNGEHLWNDDTVYKAKVKWISGNTSIASVNENVVTIHDTTISGTLLPLIAQVTYTNDKGAFTFELYYTVSVITNNATLEPGKNIDADLYDALREATNTSGVLTTDMLKAVDFVYLDLSGHPDIKDLAGLSYCANLRVLNISGLRIEKNINQIATLSKLEALIARDCGLNNLSDGGAPVLKTAINLKLLDLSHNNFTSLDSVFDPSVKYGKLTEVYLDNNQLVDISGLSRAPAMSVLTLSNNGLTTEKIAPIAGFHFLSYLSLADNEITGLAPIANLKYLEELRLQNNHITDVRDLKKLTDLKALYLGDNDIISNIDFLDNLTELRVLYLNGNRIEDISGLVSLSNLRSINVSNNSIDSLSCLERYSATLTEVYAENNEIRSFAFAKPLTNLRILLLSGNVAQEETSLTSYLSGLTKLEALGLSGKPVSDLSFLNGMTKLIRLDLADCQLPAYLVTASSIATDNTTGEKTLEISAYQDNLASLLGRKETLRYLDISNNNLAYTAEELVAYMAERGYDPGINAISFSGDLPTYIDSLYELGKLIVFYADNIHKVVDAPALTTLMTDIKYLSMENAGITDISWLSKFRGLVYVDLANNPIIGVDLGTQISTRAKESLQYLYLDTTSPDCTFAKAYRTFDENVLKALSLRNVKVESMANLPYMDQLEYLDLSGTGITDVQGHDPDYYDSETIARYQNLRTLNVTKLDADMTAVQDLGNLTSYTAVAEPSERLFYKENILTMFALYNRGVNCFLYGPDVAYTPVAETEGDHILGELKDISTDITVGADNVFSDNNPYLPDQVNNFDITWTVSNNVNYEVADNHLSVKSYENLDDEALTLTATITVYPNQAPVSRNFTVNTHILRGSTPYYVYDTTGLDDYMKREDSFTYSISVQAAETENFSVPVKPVIDDIRYEFHSVNSDGETVSTDQIFEAQSANQYLVTDDAPLNSVTTIQVKTGHLMNGSFVVDDVISRTVTIVGRNFTVTYVPNGGVVRATDGSEITSQKLPEDAVMFENVTVERTGYIFEGWYLDENFSTLFSTGNDHAIMPSEDIVLYAKWRAHSFNLLFDAGEGSVDIESKLILCDTPFGELPTPTRDYYTFVGWFTTPDDNGVQITETSTAATAEDITVYAKWQHNEVKGWIKASEVPEGAEIVGNKWTYTLKTTTESTNTSLAGYTRTGKRWVQSGSGNVNYATFPGGFDTGNWYYQNFAKGPYSASETETRKRTVSNSWRGYIYWHWMYDCGGANGTSQRAIYHQYGYGPDNGFLYKYFGAFDSSNGNYSSDTGYCNSQGIRNYIVPERTANSQCQGATRWFRFDYYNSSYVDYTAYFTYEKTEEKESSTEVTNGGNISNVVHWVQYREK